MIKGLLTYFYSNPCPFVALPREIVLKILGILAKTDERLVYDTIGKFPGYLKRYRRMIDEHFFEYRNLTRWYTLLEQWQRNYTEIPASFGLSFYKAMFSAKIRVKWQMDNAFCTVHGKHFRGTKQMIGDVSVFLQDRYVCLRIHLQECTFIPGEVGLDVYYYSRRYPVHYERIYRVLRVRYCPITKVPAFLDLEQIL
jgi:hypothetical protein